MNKQQYIHGGVNIIGEDFFCSNSLHSSKYKREIKYERW